MLRTSVALFASLLLSSSLAYGAVSAKVVRVQESRVKELVQVQDQGVMVSQLSLTVLIEGPEVAGATEYGNLKISEAADDTGASLKPEPVMEGFFMQIGSRMFMSDEQKKADKPVQIDVNLPAPQRKATKIMTVKGEIQIKAGGERKTVNVARVSTLIGKPIVDPALAAAKLSVMVINPRAPKNANDPFPIEVPKDNRHLSLKVVGDPKAVDSIDVVDRAGKSVSNERSSSGSENTTVHTFGLEKPLDATMSLKIELLTGQKIVTVPLDFKDIPLP